MARRSDHTPARLKDMILDAAEALMAESGLGGLTAREIARRIGYSPGTIYNMFENLDEVILRVEARVLDRLYECLLVSAQPADPRRRLKELAAAYLGFAHAHPRLWNVLFEHHLPPGTAIPDWYAGKLDRLMPLVEEALRPWFPPAGDERRARSARVLWAGVHGITSLSVADKLSIMTAEASGVLVDDLVTTYLSGIEHREC